MNNICNKNIPSRSIYNKQFLTRLIASLIPIAIASYYMYNAQEWFNNDILKNSFTLSLKWTFILYSIVAIILAYIWYRLNEICNSNIFDVLFSLYMGITSFYFYTYYGKKDIESAKILTMFMVIFMIVIASQVYRIYKRMGIFLIIIAVFLLFQERVLNLTYAQ
jgi:hypothetical protein